MAATVEGIFRIIDRASGPMRRMERQAQQTDRAIARLGMTTDAVGSPQQQKQITTTERAFRGLGGEVERTETRTRRLTRSISDQETRWQRLKRGIIETGAALVGLTRIIGLLKLPAMGAAIGILVQAVGALAGGVIGLLPRIADLAGAMAPIPATVLGIVSAVGVAKLAFSDLSQAMGGNAQALKRLTPEARNFMRTLQGYKGVIQDLRRTAQQGLFPGLELSIRRLQRGVPTVTALIGDMARRLGSLASFWSQRTTSAGFLRDLLQLGQQGGRVVTRMGRGLFYVVDAFRQLASAAIPFTEWMSKGAEGLTKQFNQWAVFMRDSGRFGRFLDRARSSMQMFGRILGNLYQVFRNLGRAARPLGDDLWRAFERTTESWARATGTISGQMRLMRQFIQMGPAIRAMGRLVMDLTGAVFRMGTAPGLPRIVEGLRELVPILEDLLNTFVRVFGVALVELLREVGRTLEFLTNATGPVNVMLGLLSRTLGVINDLIAAVPGLSRVLATAFSIVTIGLFIRKVQTLAATWWAVATGAGAAARAQSAVMGGGAAAAAGGGAAALGGAAGAGAVASRVVLPRGAIRGGAQSLEGVAQGGRLAALGGATGRFGRLAGRFALPATAAIGAYDFLTTPTDPTASRATQLSQRTLGVYSGLSLGYFQPPQTAGQARQSAASRYFTEGGRFTTGGELRLARSQVALPIPYRTERVERESLAGRLGQRLGRFGGDDPRTIRQLSNQVRIFRTEIARAEPLARLAGQEGREGIARLRTEVRLRREILANLRAQRADESRARAYRTIRQAGQAFDIYAGRFGQAGAATRTNADVLAAMRSLEGPGRRIIARNYTAWLAEEARRNPALRKPYRDMVREVTAMFKGMGVTIRIVNGQIYEGTAGAWNRISRAMTGPVERARQKVNAGFTAIQAKAIETLRAMGFPAGQARALVAAMERGGTVGAMAAAAAQPGTRMNEVATSLNQPARRARGGRIVGEGLRDNVMVASRTAAAPGELIVNRHTEGRVNGMLRAYGTSLGSEVTREAVPHAAPVRGFATGGRNAAGGLHPAVAGIAGNLTSRFPLQITSTTGGRHARGSLHFSGNAVDLGGSAAAMNAAAQFVMASGMYRSLTEGIHNPNLSVAGGSTVPPGHWGARTWAQHVNHIHLAAGGGGARGAAATSANALRVRLSQLRPPASGVGGLPGVAADQANLLMAAGATRRLNNALRGPSAWGGGGGGTSGSNMTLARNMMMNRWGAGEWPALRQLWQGESGFSQTATNPASGAYGIPQALPASKMGSAGSDWKTNPATQIAWGLNYIQGRYGSPSAALTAWQGRSPHWYRSGGDFIARKPTLIGVGDTEERVTITPTHRRGGGPGANAINVDVSIGTVNYNAKGDLRKVIRDEVGAAISDVASTLDEGRFEDDEDLIA